MSITNSNHAKLPIKVRGWWILLTIGCLGLLAWRLVHRTQRPLFEISFWYWHSPFSLSVEQSRDLKRLGVRKLFVRAGTFSSDGKHVVLVIPQRYSAGKVDFRIHEVFNFDPGVIRHFESFDLIAMASQIATRVDAQVKQGQKAGLDVVGVQFDFDCPTRLLPRYAELVARVRPQLRSLNHPVISATALMSWLGTRGVEVLSRQVDFLVPQAYEGETGRTVETMRPVSDEVDFRRRIGRADNLDCPFYVGIPAYGHGFLFDPQGHLSNIYRQLEPGDAFRHPAFQFISAYTSDRLGQPAKSPSESVGEEILKFKAVRASLNGEGLGDTLGFTVPTPTLLQGMLAAARETQSPNCLGGIIYRMPQGDSETTLPWPSLVAALAGKTIEPILKIQLASVTDNFDVIESAKPIADAPKDLDLEIENTGGPTFLSPDAVEVEVRLEIPGVDDIRSRDMNVGSIGLSNGKSVVPCPPSEANVFVLTRSHLSAVQKISIGPIRLLTSKRQHIAIHWIVRSADGFGIRTGSVDLIR